MLLDELENGYDKGLDLIKKWEDSVRVLEDESEKKKKKGEEKDRKSVV